jgi:ABC-type nitrate/sulfonate/bicarbonate transport system ATPase subunit
VTAPPGLEATSVEATTSIEFHSVSKRFGDVLALSGVNFAVPRHQRLGILGPSGSGKSTLLHMTAGLLEPDGGTVNVEGATEPAGRLSRCVVMPQRDLLLPWRTSLDNAGIALENQGMSRSEARAETRPYFERFGLARFENMLPSKLSGGMRQRVSFIRTLMARTDILLLDEPFGALDSITRAQMQAWLLLAMTEVPKTVLLVTHDVEEALLLGQTVVIFSARPGRVVRVLETNFPVDGPRREIVSSPEFVNLKEQALEAIE